jgi:uncharacterized membrane protein
MHIIFISYVNTHFNFSRDCNAVFLNTKLKAELTASKESVISLIPLTRFDSSTYPNPKKRDINASGIIHTVKNIMIAISMSVIRFLEESSVCHISRAKEMCTISKANIVSTVVFLIMIILTIPSALRYEAIHNKDNITNVTCYNVLPSSLGNNSHFMDPYTWIQNSLRSIIPLVVLIFLNARIINELRP